MRFSKVGIFAAVVVVCVAVCSTALATWGVYECITCYSYYSNTGHACVGSSGGYDAMSEACQCNQSASQQYDSRSGDPQALDGFKDELQAELDDQINMEAISPEDAAACQSALNSAAAQISGNHGLFDHIGDMESCKDVIENATGDSTTMGTICYYYEEGEYCSAYYFAYIYEFSVSGVGSFNGIDSTDGVFYKFAAIRDQFDADHDDVMYYLGVASDLLYP